MRKHIEEPIKPNGNMVFSIKKIFLITMIFVVIMGTVGVMATNERVKSVKIILSSGYEMDVMTTNTKVSDILNENHIILLESELSVPSPDEELSDNNTIKITKYSDEEKLNKAIENSFSAEDIIKSYTTIVEKLITVTEEIPYETITKDVSNGGESTQNKVTQAGQNGIKEVVYRVKYQNDEEIERTKISETITKQPVEKIVEVRTITITARAGDSRAATGSKADYQAYAAQRCYDKGWTSYDVECLIKLWNRESGWNIYSSNKHSGAYGIPQALPGSKMASCGSDWRTNYKTQIEWGLNYIAGRYGSPSRAWSSFCSKGWY